MKLPGDDKAVFLVEKKYHFQKEIMASLEYNSVSLCEFISNVAQKIQICCVGLGSPWAKDQLIRSW